MKNKLIGIILLASLISGCVAALVAGAGLAVYDRRTIVTIEKDARIFHLVHKNIVTNPQFQGSHIVVSSFNKVVLLAGQTPSASLRVLAEKIAHQVPGVTRVYDEITIGEPSSISQRTQDSWITGHIRSEMLTRKGLESGSIHIVTEDGVVYLMGIVTQEQANIAVDVARQVNRVRKVVKVFQYIR